MVMRGNCHTDLWVQNAVLPREDFGHYHPMPQGVTAEQNFKNSFPERTSALNGRVDSVLAFTVGFHQKSGFTSEHGHQTVHENLRPVGHLQ